MRTITHNGNIHTITSGIDLYEISNGHINHTLGEGDDFFRFTVTGTDFSTGMRSQYRFLLNASLRRADRGSLDMTYVMNLVEETVTEVLARENSFITGHVPRGEQFDRAFSRYILSTNSIALQVSNGKAIAFDGGANAIDTRKLSATDLEGNFIANNAEGRQVVVVAGHMIYTYSMEDTAKWGMDKFVPENLDNRFQDNFWPKIIAHFSKMEHLGEIAFPLSFYRQTTKVDSLLPALSFKSREELDLYLNNGAAIALKKQKPVQHPRAKLHTPVDPAYQEALIANERVMGSSRATRLPWRTHTDSLAQMGGQQ